MADEKKPRFIQKDGKRYKMEGMPKDVQELYDDLEGANTEIVRLRAQYEQLTAQIHNMDGVIKYVGEKLWKRVLQCQKPKSESK